jgi:hypothetical protein
VTGVCGRVSDVKETLADRPQYSPLARKSQKWWKGLAERRVRTRGWKTVKLEEISGRTGNSNPRENGGAAAAARTE